MQQNYMMMDLLGTAEAALVFSLFLLLPGYVLGWLGNLFDFRSRSMRERTVLSVSIAIGTTPILAVLVGRFLSLSAALGLFEAAAVVFVGILIYEFRSSPPRMDLSNEETRIAFWACLLWALIAIGALIDLQIGSRIYISSSSFDHSVRIPFTASVLRTGVPPANPFFYPGHLVPMRYYYYWYVVASLPAKLAGLSPRVCMFASCVWSLLAMFSIAILYLKYFLKDQIDVSRKSLLAILLFAVTGLDIIPTMALAFGPNHIVNPDMEWWNGDLITSWVDSAIWVPHHLASLAACLFGFLSLWTAFESEEQGWTRKKVIAAIIAGLAFASGAGLSVYVAFTFTLFLILWTLRSAVKRRGMEFALLVFAGLVALLLSVPYLRDLTGPGGGAAPFVFSVRRFSSELNFIWSPMLYSRSVQEIGSFLQLPFFYFLEFGFFFMVGAIRLAWDWKDRKSMPRYETACWYMLGTSLFVSSFLRSSVINNNDLGFRSVLPMQFVVLLWAIPITYRLFFERPVTAHQFGTVRPWVLTSLLCLGVVGTMYQVAIVRSFAILADKKKLVWTAPWMALPVEVGSRTAAMRDLYDHLDRELPTDAIVQHNPDTPTFVTILEYSGHQAVASLPHCQTVFGGDPAQCKQPSLELHRLFNMPAEEDAARLDEVCEKLKIDVLVVTNSDQAWGQKPWGPANDWVWNREAMVSNRFMRAIPCGSNYVARHLPSQLPETGGAPAIPASPKS